MDLSLMPRPLPAPVTLSDPAALAAIPTERLEAQICELAAHVDAAHCRLLLLIGEFDRRQGWAVWECASAAHWLSWKCGLALGTAREHVRVGRALESLPAVRAAFAGGELSYSKVRAITRVAEPATDVPLVEMAKASTGAVLDRICATYRRYGQEGAATAANEAYAKRDLRWWYDDDGSMVFRGRIPADQAPVVLAMLAAGRAALDQQPPDDGDAPAGTPDDDSPTDRHATPDPAKDVPAGTPDGSSPTDQQATARPAKDVPAGARRRPPATGARNADALVLVAESFLAHGPKRRAGGDRCTVNVVIDVETLTTGADGEAHLDPGRHLAADVARRLACDCTAIGHLQRDGHPLDVGRAQRLINRQQRRALQRRDKGCRMPGCTHGGFLDAHHLVHWADGGHTNIANLILLCDRHHRAVHEGGWTITATAGVLTFRRPDGVPLRTDPPAIDLRDPVEGQHRRLGLTIDEHTNESIWDNQPFDMSDIIYGLDNHIIRARAEQPDPTRN